MKKIIGIYVEWQKMGVFLKHLLAESLYGTCFDSVSAQCFQLLCYKKTLLALHNILTHSLQIHR